jgi:hypothetical protein
VATGVVPLIVKREVSAVEITDHFLGGIDEHQPTLKAILHIDATLSRCVDWLLVRHPFRGDSYGHIEAAGGGDPVMVNTVALQQTDAPGCSTRTAPRWKRGALYGFTLSHDQI